MVSIPGRIFPVTLLHPPVPCPQCRTPVQGYVRGEEAADPHHVSRDEAHQGCDRAKLTGTIVFTLHPCYCRVDQYWVSAFVAEMRLREKGGRPQPVEGVWKVNRGLRVEELLGMLTALRSRRDAALMAESTNRKSAIERDIVLKLTDLHRLSPDDFGRFPAMNLEPEVVQWARQQRLTLPRGAEVIDEEARPKISFKMLHEALVLDAEYRHLTTGEALELARAVHKELENYVNHGVPVSQATLRVAVRLVPHADKFLKVSESAAPVVDSNPESEFVASLTFRKKRRLDVRRRRRPENGKTPMTEEETE